MKQVVRVTLVVLATIIVVLLVWVFRNTVFLFLLSLVVAAAIRPVVEYFVGRGWPRGLALLVAYGISIGIIITLGFMFGGPFFTSLQQLTTDLIAGYEHIRAEWPGGTLPQRLVAQGLSLLANILGTLSEEQASSLIQFFMGAAEESFNLFGQLIVVLVFSIYWSADQERFKRLWLSLLPADARTRARDIWQSIETDLGAYLRSELLQSLLAIILLGVGYQLIGLKYPIVLGVMGAIMWLLPWVGVVFAVIPALIVGLSASPLIGLFATLWTIAVLSLMEFVVEPRIFNRQRYNSSLIIIMVIVMANLYGIVGVLFAAPLAAAIQIIGMRLMQPTITSVTEVPAPSKLQVQDLQERLESVQERLAQHDEALKPEINNFVKRLTELLERANAEH